MRFHEAANYLFDLRRFRMRPGTDATADLLAQLGSPHDDFDAVQIAGTNGKGGTARMVESILRESGLNVGLYTSPHFDDVRERVRVDGRKIPEREVVTFVEGVRDYLDDRAAAGDPPTFFEVLTALSCWHFARSDVDVGILEVGIGGKHDATSVVDPVASAVTNVSLEHTAVLGDTVEEIARDKAHVAPANAPLVTAAEGDALAAVRGVAGDVIAVGGEDADVRVTYRGRREDDGSRAGVTVAVDGWNVAATLPAPGAEQATNAGVAVALARQIADVDPETLARGVEKAHWPGRFEVMGESPLVVLDGAHNPGACEAVAATLAEFDYEDLTLVFGAMHDKDHRGMAAALPDADRVIACRPDAERAESSRVLARVFERAGVPDVTARGAVESAVDRAIAEAGPDDCVLVAGSLYVVAEARTRWTRSRIPKRVRGIDDAAATLRGAHVTDAGVWRMRGKAVHRTIKTRVQPRQARYLKEELLSLGGECAVSGLDDQDDERLDVVLTGTLAQFNRLLDKLDGQPYGLDVVGRQLRNALGIRIDEPAHGYPWEDRTAVMGILNVTPDSFHDGGEFAAVDDAIDRAETMVAEGADVVDVGGEATNPNVEATPVADELDRVLPVVERASDLDALVSVDTRRAEVARAALEAGADIVNDVSGLEDPEMAGVAADHGAPLVVMHSIDAPVVRDREVAYDDVVEDVIDQLGERVLLAEKAGLPREKIIVDPGLGFGKTAAEDFELLGRAGEFRAFGCPVLIGHSHKSMFGRVDSYPDEGGHATVAGTTLAADRGADIVRVHDVAENVAAVRAVEEAADLGDG